MDMFWNILGTVNGFHLVVIVATVAVIGARRARG